jgi:uncharacterized protein (TIGR03382 family)
MNEGTDGAPIGSPCSLVLADELSEAGILTGLQHQHTMANLRGPDDPPVEVIAHGKKGEQLTVGDDIDNLTGLEVHVTGATGYFLQLWRDGENIAQIQVKKDDFTHTFTDKASSADHRYRVQLIDDTNRPVVITSHIYAHGVAEAGGGCSAGGGGVGAFPLVGLALCAARRRRHTTN